MKKLSCLVLSLAVCFFVALPSAAFARAQAAEPAVATRILFITADGFRTDYLDWYQPPNLLKLAAEGVRVRFVTNVFPTLTTPNMTSLVTGAYPRTTGIAANKQYVRETDKIVSSPRDNQAETIAETLRRAGWSTAAVNHFMLEGRGVDAYRSAGYDDTDKTAEAVLESLKSKPRFLGVIFGAVDHAGHQYGPQSEQVKKAVLEVDQAIGRIVEALKSAGLYDETAISFNADHGMTAIEDKGASIEPAKALREAGFKVATSPETLQPDTQIVVISLGVRLVYFRGQLSAEQKTKAVAVLSQIQGVQILDRQALDKLHCHPSRSGDLIVAPLPGFTISNAGRKGGEHGRFAERNPVLIFRGPGFRSHAVVDSAETVDIVPTLLHLGGVQPAGTVDGHVLRSCLAQP